MGLDRERRYVRPGPRWSASVRPEARWSALAVAVAVGATAMGCATAPPPAPGPVEARPPAASPAAATRSDVRLEPVAPPEPPRPWLEPAITSSPAAPLEGTATAVWIRVPPGGRQPERVEARLDGRAIPVTRTPDGWFGVAPIPIGTTGPAELTVRLRLPGGPVVERHRSLEARPRDFPATRLRVAPRYSAPSEALRTRIEEERERIREALTTSGAEWIPRGEFAWPRPPRITSPFGQRRLFNDELHSRHTGLDLGGASGAPVRAAAAGRVALVGEFFYQGNAVYVDHGLGVFTGYFHLSRVDVAPGDRVVRGQVVGGVGATGRVTGPHLHWSAYVDGETVDPSSLLDLELPSPEATVGDAATAPERR